MSGADCLASGGLSPLLIDRHTFTGSHTISWCLDIAEVPCLKKSDLNGVGPEFYLLPKGFASRYSHVL